MIKGVQAKCRPPPARFVFYLELRRTATNPDTRR